MIQELLTAWPEEVGISSSHIQAFLERLEKNRICMHSVMIVRKGKLILEGHYSPLTKDHLHRMFSVTKSLASIAIGLLEEEKKLSLDDEIIKYFEDKLPQEGVHPYTAKTTIRHMLQMTTAQSATTYKQSQDEDWTRTFFTVTPSHLPGKIFSYDTSASHVLGALVERLTGMTLLEYLKVKGFDEIGFSKEAYILKDPVGVSMGGSGLVAKPTDLLKLGILLLNQGNHQGKQLLPASYLKRAIRSQIDTSIKGPTVEEKQGYGYQFWRTRNNGFMCYGMGGQFIVCLPDEDLLLVTTADTQPNPGSNQLLFNAFWEEIYEKVSHKPLSTSVADLQALQTKVSQLTLLKEEGERYSSLMDTLEGSVYHFPTNEVGLKNISFHFEEKQGTFTYLNETGEHSLPFGLGEHVCHKFPYYESDTVSHGVWKSENELVLTHYLIGENVGTIYMYFTFEEDTVSVLFRKIEETLFKEFSGFASGEKEK